MTINRFVWTKLTPPGTVTTRLRDMDYSSSLGQYCVVGDGGKVITSSDGTTWTEQTSGFTGSYFLDVKYANSLWVAVGGDNTSSTPPAIYTSPDGVTWTSRSLAVNANYLYGIVWTGTNFVVCGTNYLLATSPDGITWTQRSAPEAGYIEGGGRTFHRVAFDGSRVVVMDLDARSFYSDDDGVTWTRGGDIYNIEAHDNKTTRLMKWTGSCFLAASTYFYPPASAAGRVNVFASSADGYTWIEEPFPYDMVIKPFFYSMATDGAGETIVKCGGTTSANPETWRITGTSGNLTFEQITPHSPTGLYWFQGGCHDGSAYIFCGDADYYYPTSGSNTPMLYKGEYAGSQIVHASNPNPAHQVWGDRDAVGESINVQLSWTPAGIGTHAVYFGTDRLSLSYMGNVGVATTYNPGTLDYNHTYWWRVDVIDGATTYTGETWHFITESQAQPDDEITVFQDTSNLTTTSSETYPWLVVCDFDHTLLTHGHRYLYMTSGKWYSASSSVGVIETFIGDSTETIQVSPSPWPDPHQNFELYYYTRGIFYANGKYLGHQSVGLLDLNAGEDVVYQAYRSTGTISRAHQYATMIDLDSPGMQEGVDWWYAGSKNYNVKPAVSWTDAADDLKITFTPDGYSDYLVIACTNWYGYNVNYNAYYYCRIYDNIVGELARAGYGANSNQVTRDYEHGHGMSHVLEAPSATPHTISIQTQGTDWEGGGLTPWYLYGSTLVVLRLTKFASYGVAQNSGSVTGLTNYMHPSNNYDKDNVLGRIKFQTDSKGKAVSVFSAECDPTTVDSTGAAFLVQRGQTSTYMYDTNQYPPGSTVGTNDIYVGNTADSNQRVPYFGSRRVTGLSGQQDFITYAATINANDIITRNSLVVFGTEYRNAPDVFNFSPSKGSSSIPKNQAIYFDILGPNGVDKDTLNVAVYEGSGWVDYSASTNNILGIAYGSADAEGWCGVATSGVIITSQDGYTWTQQTSPVSQHFRGVHYDNGLWVAVGDLGQIATSPDGVNWTDRTTGTTRFYDVTYGNSTWVAVGDSGNRHYSSDGVTWTSSSGGSITYYSIAYDPVIAKFCAVGHSGQLSISSDGISWTDYNSSTTGTTEYIYGVASNGAGRFMGVCLYTHLAITSTNGTSWTVLETHMDIDLDLRDIWYGDGKWVATGTNGKVIVSDDDGTTWYEAKTLHTSTINSVHWAEGKGWIGACSSGNVIATGDAGLNVNPRWAVVNGAIQPDFNNSGAFIDERDGYDGYKVCLVPSYPTFQKNSMIRVKVDADDHQANSMSTYESWYYLVDGHLKVLFDEDTTYGNGSLGWTAKRTYEPGELTPGHRHLFIVYYSHYQSNASNYQYLVFRVNGNENTNYRYLCRFSYSRYEQMQEAFVYTPNEGETLVFDHYRYQANYETSGSADFRFMVIDLDSDPGAFIEGDNFFLDSNGTRLSNMDNVYTNNIGASITFTPDGTSDYLIIASPHYDSISSSLSKIFKARIYDSIDGELWALDYKNSSNPYGGVELSKVMFYMLSAPAATSRTVSLQLQGDSEWDVDACDMIIIKMDSFAAKGWTQTLTQQNGLSTSSTLTSLDTLNFDPDNRRQTVLLGAWSKQQVSGYGNDGMHFEVQQNGAVRISDPRTDTYRTSRYEGYNTGVDQIISVRLQNNVAPATDFTTYAGSYSASHYLYKRNLIAFGTELVVAAPDKAANPNPPNTQTEVNLDQILSWDAAPRAVTYDVYFGTNPDPSGDFMGNQVGTTFDPPGDYLTLAQTYYWRVDAIGDGGTTTGDVWSFTTVLTLPPPTKATNPNPVHDETGVSVDKIVSWTKGTSLVEPTHDVHFGTDPDPDNTFIGNQAGTTFDPGYLNPKTGKLDSDTDYYWRVDEVNVGGTTTGDVWHFHTEYIAPPTKATNPNPGNFAGGIIPDQNITWSAGSGAISHDVYFGVDPDPSSNYIGNQFSTTYNPPSDLILGTTYYWRIDEVGPGGTTTGDVWHFTVLETLPKPTQASEPNPSNGQRTVDPAAGLNWSPGTGIPYIGEITNDVYFGTDSDPSINFVGNFANPSYSPGNLQYSQTYYWRVDTVSQVSGTTTGSVWSFDTAPILTNFPRNGDKVAGTLNVGGNTRPLVGVHAEIHSDHLLADGYVTTDINGDFAMTIRFENQDYGTKLRLVMVTRASPDSEEVTINLIQGRPQLSPVQVRTGRRMTVDESTLALWRLGKSSLAEAAGGTPKVYHNFITSEASSPPSGWSRYGVIGFQPTWENQIMTTHCYSTPGIYSYMTRNNNTDCAAIFDPGFKIRYNFRTSKATPFSPNDSTQILSYNVYDNRRFSFQVLNDYLYFGSVQASNRIDNNITWDRHDWTTVEIRGKEMVAGDDNSCYLEAYVNDRFVATAFASTGSGFGNYLGQVFTGSGTYTSTDFGFYILQEQNPFVAHPGTNIQGDTARDLPMNRGTRPIPLSNLREAGTVVPFNYCTEFLGNSTSYMQNDDVAFDISGAFTVEGWFRAAPGSTGSIARVLMGKQSLNASGWVLRIDDVGQLQAALYNGTENVANTGVTMLEGEWYYVALVWNGSYLYLYVNGEERIQVPLGYTANSAQPFRLGAYSESTSNTWYGYVADVRYSNVARGGWEIYNTYAALQDPHEGLPWVPGTLLRYNFDDDSGRTRALDTDRVEETVGAVDFTDGKWREYFGENLVQGADVTWVTSPVHNDRIRVSVNFDAANGNLAQAYLNGAYTALAPYGGRPNNRLVGNFDVSIDIFLKDDLDNYTWTPPPHSSSETIRLMASTNSGSTAQNMFVTFASGATQYIRHQFYQFAYGQDPTSLHDTVNPIFDESYPDRVTLRIARLGNMWYGYFGVNGAPATNYLGKTIGPEDDCYLRVYHSISGTYTSTGTYYYEVGNLRIKGSDISNSHAVVEDGYFFRDVHSADAYGTGNERAFVPSVVGNKARTFESASNMYLQIPNHAEWNHQDITVDMWFKATSLQDGMLVHRGNRQGNAEWHIQLNVDGTITASITDTANNNITVTGGSYTAGAWYYLVMTFDVSTREMRLYLNSINVTSGTMSSSNNDFSSNSPIDIGRDIIRFDKAFDGALGAFRILNIVLSPKDIFNYYHGTDVKETR